MKLTIAHPYIFLLLIPALALCLAFGKNLRIGDVQRKRATIAMRICLVSLLVLAMAGVGVSLKQKSIATIYLVDLSDSTSGDVPDMTKFMREAFAKLPEEELAGAVAFGYDSTVEKFVKKNQTFSDFGSAPISSATNMEQAITTAMTMYPEDCGKRMVLLTDGQENAGDVKNMLSTLTSNSVVLEVKRLERGEQKEVYISDVKIPEKIHTGDSFKVEVEVESTVDTSAVISLYAGKKLKGRENVSLQRGSNQFVFKDKRNEEGFFNYRAVIEAAQDGLDLNNEYVAYTQADEQKGILLIEGESGKAKHFEKVLRAGNIEYEKLTPDWAPGKMQEFQQYKSIVMVDVHAEDLPGGFMKNIESYVGDYGGGLVAIGGENSFALGAYRDTPLEKVLPVNMDMEGEKEIPKMAVVLVIDHSGSMSETMGGGYSKLELARESAVSAMKNMREADELGVLSFDDTYQWKRPLGEITDRDEAEEDIRSIPEGGGTNIYPALDQAEKIISKSDANTKHIILLTDGQDEHREYADLVARMKKHAITLSTVAVGSDADNSLLENLAEAGEGRFYETDGESDMPRIFAKEIFLSAEGYLVNREFTPVPVKDNGMLTDVLGEGLPPLLGYIGSAKKNLATSLLVSDAKDPILTSWQYGLGKTVAFNSDVENIWTAEFAKWEQYPLFWRNIINWTVTELDDDAASLEIESAGQTAKLTYTSRDYKADTRVKVVVTDDEGAQQNYTLEATAPGVYETELQFSKTGVYSILAEESVKEETVAVKNSAVAVQYSNEYRVGNSTENFDSFLEEAGAIPVEAAKDVYSYKPKKVHAARNLTNFFLVLALLLFAWDVTARRLSLSLVVLFRDSKVATHARQRRKEGKEKTLKDTDTKRQKRAEGAEEILRNTKRQKVEEGAEETLRNTKRQKGKEGVEQTKETVKAEKIREDAIREKAEDVDIKDSIKMTKREDARTRKKTVNQDEDRTTGLDTAALLQKKRERNGEF